MKRCIISIFVLFSAALASGDVQSAEETPMAFLARTAAGFSRNDPARMASELVDFFGLMPEHEAKATLIDGFRDLPAGEQEKLLGNMTRTMRRLTEGEALIDGDRCVVTAPELRFHLKKVDGQWTFDPEADAQFWRGEAGRLLRDFEENNGGNTPKSLLAGLLRASENNQKELAVLAANRMSANAGEPGRILRFIRFTGDAAPDDRPYRDLKWDGMTLEEKINGDRCDLFLRAKTGEVGMVICWSNTGGDWKIEPEATEKRQQLLIRQMQIEALRQQMSKAKPIKPPVQPGRR